MNSNNNNNNNNNNNIAAQASSHLEEGTNNEGMEVSPCEEYYREQDEEEKAVVILLFAMGLVLGYDDLIKRIRRVGRIKIRRKHKLKVAQKRYEMLRREQQTRICVIPKPTAAWSVDQLERWMHANPITGQNNIDFVRSTMESTDFGLNPPFVVVIRASSNEQHVDANNDEPQEEEEEEVEEGEKEEGSDNTAQASFMGVAVLPGNENDNGYETNRESHQVVKPNPNVPKKDHHRCRQSPGSFRGGKEDPIEQPTDEFGNVASLVSFSDPISDKDECKLFDFSKSQDAQEIVARGLASLMTTEHPQASRGKG